MPTPRPASSIYYDTHMHTPLCKHAVGEPEAYADVAEARGLTGIVMTCHNPLPDGISLSVRMMESQFDEYIEMVHRAAQARQGRVDVRLGMECDYWPGLEPYLEKQLKRADFHHILGSIHPGVGYYAQRFHDLSPKAMCEGYFTHLALAAESGLFDTISHPDLIKNSIPQEWDVAAVLDHVLHCLDRIARAGTAMELNTSGVNKVVAEFNPGQRILREMASRQIPLVLGSDSHVPQRVGADFETALQNAADAGYRHVSFFLDRRRQEIAIDDALNMLKPLPAEKAS